MMVRQLKPGSYTWSVTAKDSMGQESASSELWRFSVDGIPLLPWADRKTEERLQYKTEKPVLRAAWERGDEGAVSWRVRLIQGREPASESKWRAVSQPQTVLGLQGPGVYQLEVEALDAQGRVIAKTPLRTVEVEQAPPLAPPEFGDGLASEIKARGDGSVDLVWKPVLDAKKYLVSIKSRSGEIIRTLNVTTERTEVSGLKTGEYLVTLQSIDELGRVGPESGSRSLQVPEYSNLPAPKLKKVNVK